MLRHPTILRLLVLAIALWAAWLPTQLALGGVERIEGVVGDWVWRAAARGEPERRVVVVDIDERSLREVGPWPWPRSTLAALSERLREAGAQLQVYDIVLPELRDGDEALRAAWDRAPVVAAQLFALDDGIAASTGEVLGALAALGCPDWAPRATGYYGIAPTLDGPGTAHGHITPRIEADGVVRKVPALICFDGRAHASLALVALWRAAQAPVEAANAPDWQWSPRHGTGLLGRALAPAFTLRSPSLPGIEVPLDAGGNLRVPYDVARSALVAVSAAELLAGGEPPAVLRGAIALVGATAFGMGDTVSTPHGAVSSGVEVHAQTLVGLLDQRVPATPAAWPALQWGLALLLAGVLWVLATAVPGVTAKRLPLAGLALAVAVVTGFAAALQQGLWLPWFMTATFALVGSVSLATAEHALARAQRERLSAHLGAYLPEPVSRRLLSSEPSGALQAERVQAAVLAADIRNFPAFVARSSPDEVAALLHAYCCLAVDVVERHGGVVESIVGDAVLALWLRDDAEPDRHAQRAVDAAKDLLRASNAVLQSTAPTKEYSAAQPLALGVGCECGEVIVGSLGPAQRRVHAALGEPVTLAHRLQRMTADLSVPALVGPGLAARLPSRQLETLGTFLVEGMSKHCEIFTPADWRDLVVVDPGWAAGAASAEDGAPATTPDWSRWRTAPNDTAAQRTSGSDGPTGLPPGLLPRNL